jgi:hypothetical protein
MSFNRLSYDSCAYSKTLQQSIDPLEYNLFKGKFESCTTCSVGDYTNNLDFGIRSEIESDLKGQSRVGSKCPSEKFPNNANTASPFTPAITCQGIYDITPNNLVKPTTNGLKDINSYGQNVCMIK